MQIIEVNHKTVAKLLKKTVEKYWLEGKDAYLKFTDGSIVCIHVLKPSWETYVNLQTFESSSHPAFVDSTENHLCFLRKHEETLFTLRTVSIYFKGVHYYISDELKYAARTYIPVIEFHYYEVGEDIGNHNS